MNGMEMKKAQTIMARMIQFVDILLNSLNFDESDFNFLNLDIKPKNHRSVMHDPIMRITMRQLHEIVIMT